MELRLPLSSSEEAEEWLKAFEDTSYITWKVRQSFKPAGTKQDFRVMIFPAVEGKRGV